MVRLELAGARLKTEITHLMQHLVKLKSSGQERKRFTRYADFTTTVFLTVVGTVFSLHALEIPSYVLFPELSLWSRQVMEILFGSFIATVGASFLLRNLRGQLLRTREEVATQKEMQEALRLERDRFMSILDSMGDGVYIVNGRQEIEYVNPVIKQEFGPVEGIKCYTHFHDRTEVCPWCKNQEVLSGKSMRRVWTSRKSHRTYDLFETPLRKPDGSVSNLQIFRDITERIAAEEALRAGETKFRKLSQEFEALLDAIPDTIALLSSDMVVLWANNGTGSQGGGCNPKHRGQLCYQAVEGRAVLCEDCPALRSFATGKPEAKMMISDGRYLDRRAFPIRDSQGIDSVILIVSDVTERTMMEAEVTQACHLASLGQLAAGIAHEINNPINGVINYAQMIINMSKDGSRERDIAERMIKESTRIAGIVRSLLSFARTGTEEEYPIQVAAILMESLVLTQTQMLREGIKVEVDVASSLPPIKANFQQIQQVFLNIMNNARYALNEKYPGRNPNKILKITGKEIRTGGRRTVRLCFHDHGTGIPPEHMAKVTSAFFSTKPKGKGTGLGLSISRGIVHNHGGDIRIESVDGAFTRVIVDLPV